jgi:hypothetical protein
MDYGFDKDTAVAAWNTRADTAEVIALRTEVAECHANINTKADFIDATINQAAADSEQIAALRKRMEAADADRRMIVSHATMGATTGEGLSVNDISVMITRLRNEMYEAGAAHARATGAA